MMKLRSWLADHLAHLANRSDEFSYYVERRERLAYAYRSRRQRLARRFWVRRRGFVDRVGLRGSKVADGYWVRRQRRAGRRAGRRADRPTLRTPIVMAVSLGVGLIVIASVSVRGSVRGPSATPAPREHTPSAVDSDAVSGIDVPNVRGMSAAEARVVLESVGLTFRRAKAALGTPGRVIGTLPSIGRTVSSGTPITLMVGVEAERIGPTNALASSSPA